MSKANRDKPEAKAARWFWPVSHWPVPKTYKKNTEGEERAHERKLLHDAQKDAEAVNPPRRHRKDHQYFW